LPKSPLQKISKHSAPPANECSDSDPTSYRPPDRLIDRLEVLRRIPVSFSTLLNWMRDGNFPQSRGLVGKQVWLESEIEHWIATRPIRSSDQTPMVPGRGFKKKSRQKAEA
jgi:predicted DNA-binding transcriptional regulator AlpA